MSLIAFGLVAVVSIWVGQWKGLFLWVCGMVVVIAAMTVGLL